MLLLILGHFIQGFVYIFSYSQNMLIHQRLACYYCACEITVTLPIWPSLFGYNMSTQWPWGTITKGTVWIFTVKNIWFSFLLFYIIRTTVPVLYLHWSAQVLCTERKKKNLISRSLSNESMWLMGKSYAYTGVKIVTCKLQVYFMQLRRNRFVNP